MEQQTPREPGAAINGHPVPELLDHGGGEEPTAPPARPSRWRARLRPDRFVLRGLAALGAAGLFGSLITAWQRYELQVEEADIVDPEGISPILVHLSQLGVLAYGFLGAAIALAGCVALALFGRVSGRGQARVLALAMAGAALACATALVVAADSDMIQVGGLIYTSGDSRFELHTENGTWFGIGGVALLGIVAWFVPRPRGEDLPPASAGGPERDPDADEWRRPVAPRHADETPASPLDLSVEPVEPFHRFTDDRREPWR
ncbi:hypothetical protein [Catenuloplanes atrovinosus]|uniref:MFS family permease n=1 Tax=Catenuloplanes atrovinosus TaxID=137266 RepID=A0AAE4CD92_9ACTN|nr:hypothetical protein [Catenuloplanes atrovinosus]MDR7279973.1 MFS family permease [Catenuloplanes atrovinosus]